MATTNNTRARKSPFFVGNVPVPWQFGNHVVSGLEVSVPTGVAPRALVGTGVAVVDGKAIHLYTETYALVPADPSLPRVDLVQIGIGTINKVTVKPGVPAATPAAPNPDSQCIPLATILVPASATTLAYWAADMSVRPTLVNTPSWQ